MRARQSMIALGVLAVVGAVAFGGWYAFVRGETPPPVSLESALQGIESPAAGTRATPAVAAATTANTATTSTAGSPTKATRANPVGAWALEGGTSFVGYRIEEQLAQVGANTAVGRTSTVEGELNFDGARVTALRVKADMRNLRSDDNRRDTYLRRDSLQTATFTEAVFTLADPIPVSVTPAEGATMSTTATGDLTVHGVTKRVQVPVEGKLSGGKLVVVGSTRVALADFGIAKPRAQLVLSVQDNAVIELSLVFAPAGG
jgi:polyisoprenoid-binding protein YceI